MKFSTYVGMTPERCTETDNGTLTELDPMQQYNTAMVKVLMVYVPTQGLWLKRSSRLGPPRGGINPNLSQQNSAVSEMRSSPTKLLVLALPTTAPYITCISYQVKKHKIVVTLFIGSLVSQFTSTIPLQMPIILNGIQ